MRAPLPEKWSYSALHQYLRVCGAQYLFQRIEEIEPEEESPNLVLGSCLHHAHAVMRVRQKNGEPVVLDEARQVFVESFQVLSANPIVTWEEGEAECLQEQGLKYVELLHKNLGTETVEAVELDFEVPLVDGRGEVLERPLRGTFDLVVRTADGRRVVVDLKTAATRYSADKVAKDLQATCYAYAASRLWPDRSSFRFDVVVKSRSPSFQRIETVRDVAAFERLIALVRTAERGIEAGVFVPADGSFYCNGCGFRSRCAKWGAVPGVSVPTNGNGTRARVPA